MCCVWNICSVLRRERNGFVFVTEWETHMSWRWIHMFSWAVGASRIYSFFDPYKFIMAEDTCKVVWIISCHYFRIHPHSVQLTTDIKFLTGYLADHDNCLKWTVSDQMYSHCIANIWYWCLIGSIHTARSTVRSHKKTLQNRESQGNSPLARTAIMLHLPSQQLPTIH